MPPRVLQSKIDKMRQKALQNKLRSGFMALPEPQYTYEIEVPEVCMRLLLCCVWLPRRMGLAFCSALGAVMLRCASRSCDPLITSPFACLTADP